MGFKEQVQRDISNVFFNLKEFADIHNINGKEMPVIIDNEELTERKLKANEINNTGLYKADTLFYVPASVYGVKPGVDQKVTFDGISKRVVSVTDTDGIYEILLGAFKP